jgi:hypothetical protein
MTRNPRLTWCAVMALTLAAIAASPKPEGAKPATQPLAKPATGPVVDKNTTALFDGKTLKNWKVTEFGGEGEAHVEDGQIVVGAGSTLSGVNWAGGALPKVNYEIELDAMKISGSDFFCALTFPYKESHSTLVLGGWGGSLIGISSINGNDAANNEHTTTRDFPKGKWVHVKLRVTPNRIKAWLDRDEENPVLDVDTDGVEIGTRADIDAARPLGLSTFQTSAAYKNITLKKLP